MLINTTKCSVLVLIMTCVIITSSCDSKTESTENAGVTVASAADSTILTRRNRPIGMCTADLPRTQQSMVDSFMNTTFYEQAKDNASFKSFQRKYAVGSEKSYWRKKFINVVFVGGDPAVQLRVINTARKWEPITNIKFNFDQRTRDTDISISFTPRVGTYSVVGRESKGNTPSMNYDNLYADDDDKYYEYYVLHEFGHALGLEHEHQSYNSNVVWNIKALFNYCQTEFDPPWDSAQIYDNIIYRFSREMVTATRYDPSSIMMYTFPDSLVASGYVPQEPNFKISGMDATFLNRQYSFLISR